MERTARHDDWTLERWHRKLRLDEDLGRPSATLPLGEELRIVLALVALALVAMLVV